MISIWYLKCNTYYEFDYLVYNIYSLLYLELARTVGYQKIFQICKQQLPTPTVITQAWKKKV